MTVVTAGNTAMKSGPTVHLLGRDGRLRREPRAGGARVGRHRQDRPLGRHPARLLQRPEEDGRGLHSRCAGPATSCPATTPRWRRTGRSPCSAGARSSSTPAARRSSPRRSSPPCAPTPTSWTPSCAARPTSAGARRWPPSSSPGSGTRRRRSSRSRSTAGTTIAGYKLPRRLYVVDAVERSPSGKPDYTWAAAIVNAGARGASDRSPGRHPASTPSPPVGRSTAPRRPLRCAIDTAHAATLRCVHQRGRDTSRRTVAAQAPGGCAASPRSLAGISLLLLG